MIDKCEPELERVDLRARGAILEHLLKRCGEPA
jgi:hypothetical protein